MTSLRRLAASAALTVLSAAQAFCLTPGELGGLLARNEPLTVVDIRSPAEYAEAHVPGAMNVPAPVLARKRLPGLGRVVVCGDALRAAESAAAVGALNAMAGIRAEVLEGGFGAWEELNAESTRDPGMKPERPRYARYEDVQQAAAEGRGVILVDLRRASAAGRSVVRRPQDVDSELTARFPGASAVHPARERRPDGRDEISTAALPTAKDPTRIFVLVDDGNGDAEQMARRIRAARLGQVVILAGGAEAVDRQGQPGRRTREFGGSK